MRFPSRRPQAGRSPIALTVALWVMTAGCGEAGTGPDSDVSVTRQVAVTLQTNDLAYDARRGLIYAAVASTSANHANTIAAIDPRTGSIAWTVDVGSDPAVLALAEGSSTLWIGLGGASAIQRVDLQSRSASALRSLGSSWSGPHFAEDLVALPGQPERVAVSLYSRAISPRHLGVAVFDEEGRLPMMTGDHTGSNRIEGGDNPNTLYGYNNETTEFGLRRLLVNDEGVREASIQHLVQGFQLDMAFGGGRLFFTDGSVVDPTAGIVLGTIPLLDESWWTLVRPHTAAGVVYTLQGTSLRAFDWDRLVLRGSYSVPGVGGTVGSLILVGDSALAYRTHEQVVIVPVSVLR